MPGNQKSSKLLLSLICTEKVLFSSTHYSNFASLCTTSITNSKRKKKSQGTTEQHSMQTISAICKCPLFFTSQYLPISGRKLLAHSSSPVGKATNIFSFSKQSLLDKKEPCLLLLFNLSSNVKLLMNLAGRNTVCFLCVVKIQSHSSLITCKMNLQNVKVLLGQYWKEILSLACFP